MMRARIFLLLLALPLLLAPAAQANELRELYRGVRAQAMGNAFTALADDEEALFYNPAGLAGNTSTSFHYLPLDASISSDFISSARDGVTAFRNLTGDSLNVVMGKNIFAQGTLSPTLMVKGFAISYLMDQQLALYSQNIAMPQLTLGYQTTNGVQAGYGFSVKPARRQKSELRFGIGAKVLARRGGYHVLPLETILTINKDTLGQVTGNYGVGYGVDLGSQYIYKIKKDVNLMAGLAFTDIGDTNFGNGPDPQKGNLSAGLAGTYGFGNLKVTGTYDYRHILQDADWRKKNHIGLELGVPFMKVFAGISQVSPTYGASFDIWVVKATVAYYTEELGAFAYQNQRSTYMLRIDLKFGL